MNIYFDNTILKTINIVTQKNYTPDDLTKYMNDKSSLDTIFSDIKIDYKNIKYIIFSMPKTGSTTLFYSFSNHGICLHFHSIIELLYKDLRFIRFTIKDIITFLELHNEKIYIISSYRNPIDRIISHIYHDIGANIRDTSSINNIIDYNFICNNSYNQPFNVYYINILKNEFDIDFYKLNNYNKEFGYGIYNYTEKIIFIFTHLEDFDKFSQNIPKLLNLENFKINEINNNINPEYINKKLNNDDFLITKLNHQEEQILKYYKLI